MSAMGMAKTLGSYFGVNVEVKEKNEQSILFPKPILDYRQLR